ncbi:hypothetical protein LDENG_00190350, partial [Lucifuga dentata]
AVSSSQDWISGSESELRVKPGENITLHCDCKSSAGVYIVWYRNCSHENQPPLVLRTQYVPNLSSNSDSLLNPFPNFDLLENQSSYDLLIKNITYSDEGLYYCGTEGSTVTDQEKIKSENLYTYSNITTRILLNSSDRAPPHVIPQDPDMCWKLLFILCPAFAVLSSLICSILVYWLCLKTAHQNTTDTSNQTSGNQDEDVCYAAVEIRQASQRPQKKKDQSSDFSTYSAINTGRM